MYFCSQFKSAIRGFCLFVYLFEKHEVQWILDSYFYLISYLILPFICFICFHIWNHIIPLKI